jgi:senataxin
MSRSLLQILLSQWKDRTKHSSICDILDIHVDILVSVAFADRHAVATWANARQSTRDLIRAALLRDVEAVANAVSTISSTLAKMQKGSSAVASSELCLQSMRSSFWSKLYSTTKAGDLDTMANVISLIGHISIFDNLHLKAFKPTKGDHPKETVKALQGFAEKINDSFDTIRGGFLDLVIKFTNQKASSNVLDLLRKPGMVPWVIKLMFSPVESLQTAARTLVGQAFDDVDVRLECFRALFQNLPAGSMQGVTEHLSSFNAIVPLVPEACGLSKTLVRCLTDVLEVLCDSPDGVLLRPGYASSLSISESSDVLLVLWEAMVNAINIIFKRTAAWSAFFENDEMTAWMRDVLIFGRDLLDKRRVIENAISSSFAPVFRPKDSKLSPAGRKMLGHLYDTVPELTNWMRITDAELLHQSYSFMMSLLDCFVKHSLAPPEEKVEKLRRIIQQSRDKRSDKRQTHLDRVKLSKLETSVESL